MTRLPRTLRSRRYTIDGGRFTLDGGDLLIADPPYESAPDGWGFDWAHWKGSRPA
jgi:hypothetical protein